MNFSQIQDEPPNSYSFEPPQTSELNRLDIQTQVLVVSIERSIQPEEECKSSFSGFDMSLADPFDGEIR